MKFYFQFSFTNWEGGDDAGEGGGLQFLLLVSGVWVEAKERPCQSQKLTLAECDFSKSWRMDGDVQIIPPKYKTRRKQVIPSHGFSVQFRNFIFQIVLFCVRRLCTGDQYQPQDVMNEVSFETRYFSTNSYFSAYSSGICNSTMGMTWMQTCLEGASVKVHLSSVQ